MDYYAIVTNQGKTKIARALQNGTALNITKFCVGDGGGSAVTPSASQTKLVNQKWIGNVTSYTSANDTISATTVVPANVGSFTVREMGIIDSDGDLFAVANVPDTVKNNSSSILSTLNLTISVKVDNAETVKFTVVESNNDYCICKAAANIADKVAECENFALTKGKKVVVEFTNVNTADSVTLNINNTGAKALRSGGSALKANMLLANQPYELIYDGTAYEIVGAVVTTQIAPISLGKETISLNTITEIGDYFAGSGNNVTDYPTGATKGGGLTLRVCQSGDSSRLQIFLNQNGMWLRSSRDVSAKTWNGWIKVYSSANAVKINGTVFDGTADITVPATPTFTALVSKDLNTVTAQGFYGGGANNSCTNLPTEVSTFMLIVSKNTSGTGYTQLLVDTATQKMYVRNYYNQKWQDWIGISTDGHTHSNTEITGLGNCATKNLAITVAQGNTNPVTSNAVYSALENIKNNGLNVIVATYDTPYDLKSKADYICTKDNASTVLQTALNTLKKGGTLELLQGTYTLQYLAGSLTFPAEGITIKGQGFSTSIQQPVNVEAGEALPIFNITKSNIKIKDVMLCDSIVSSPQSIVSQSAEGVTYDNIFFIYTAISNSIEVDNACIKGIGSCKFTRIQNCRVFKQASNNNKIMFDFGECTNFSGVIGGNINSGSDNISVKFAENNHKNATAIYGHTAIDITINN